MIFVVHEYRNIYYVVVTEIDEYYRHEIMLYMYDLDNVLVIVTLVCDWGSDCQVIASQLGSDYHVFA